MSANAFLFSFHSQGNIADTEYTKKVITEAKPTAIIHLAGLQIPTCRANPILGAQVNVIGTLNVFEAAKAVKVRLLRPFLTRDVLQTKTQ